MSGPLTAPGHSDRPVAPQHSDRPVAPQHSGLPVGTVLRAVAGHPRLWPVAASAILRLAAPGWWRRWPPLPLPAEQYWAFRLETMYGDHAEGSLRPQDVRAYLQWCRGTGGSGR